MKIHEVELLTDDIQKTNEFYSEKLGLLKIYSDLKTIEFKIGTSHLKFVRSSNQQPTYHFAFTIPNNKLEEAIHWVSNKVNLIKTGEDNIIADFETWKAKSIYFYDNNRNIVELIARIELNNPSNDSFTTSAILSISEIGIVTDDPISFGNDLAMEHGICYFSKGPKREDFVAMGNDNGLFVISKTNRIWYPTTKAGQKHRTKIKVVLNDKVVELRVN